MRLPDNPPPPKTKPPKTNPNPNPLFFIFFFCHGVFCLYPMHCISPVHSASEVNIMFGTRATTLFMYDLNGFIEAKSGTL